MTHQPLSRRALLSNAGLAAAGAALLGPARSRAEAPAAPVALARCNSYGPEVLPTLRKMFDQLGGLGRLVKPESRS
jgi:nitrous oxide reductase